MSEPERRTGRSGLRNQSAKPPAEGAAQKRFRKMPRRLVVAGLASVALLMAGSIFYFKTPDAGSGGTPKSLAMAEPEAGYVDAQQCATCHRKIWDTYRRTGMGRSFARVRPGDKGPQAPPSGSYYHELSDQHYRTYEKEGRHYQRRHQIGYGGKETNVVEKEIHFVIGSGNHVRTYLHQTPDGRIFELPGGWYAENGGFGAMNPGYDRPGHDNFRRQITGKCLFCHTGYPEIEKGFDRIGTAPVFAGAIPEGIDCQRCHGPGRAHIAAAGVSGASLEAIGKAIVNPGKLSPERQMDVCMQCHLETTSFRLPPSIVRYSRGIFSFRPGEPLADYILHFDHAAGTGYEDKFEIAGAAYRLRKSACFVKSAQAAQARHQRAILPGRSESVVRIPLKSDGALQCTTCHNPHDIPRGAEAKRHYTAVCLNCHAGDLHRVAAVPGHTASDDCVGCHMPKRRTDDAVRVVMTDHFIQRRKPARDLLAPMRERQETEATAYKGEVVLYPHSQPPDAGSELYVAVAQVRQGTNLKEGIPRLEKAIEKNRPKEGEFYFELAEAYGKNRQVEKSIATYEAALQRSPDFWPAMRGLGTALAKLGRLERAAAIMQQALTRIPGDPAGLNDLALVYIRQGRSHDAIDTLRKALQIDPDLADAHNNLGGALATIGDRSGAEEAYRNAIRVQPDLAGAHKNLADLLGARDDFAESEYFYRRAIRSDRAYVAAYYDFGVALAKRERFRDAAEQFETAVRLDAAHAEAHNSLGDMAALLGNPSQAIRHYERAIAAKPDLAAAHLGLGSTLAALGKRAAAIPHFEKAASGTDPAVRQAALDAIGARR